MQVGFAPTVVFLVTGLVGAIAKSSTMLVGIARVFRVDNCTVKKMYSMRSSVCVSIHVQYRDDVESLCYFFV